MTLLSVLDSAVFILQSIRNFMRLILRAGEVVLQSINQSEIPLRDKSTPGTR